MVPGWPHSPGEFSPHTEMATRGKLNQARGGKRGLEQVTDKAPPL